MPPHRYVVVALLDARAAGETFPASAWPLHVTIVAPFTSFEAPDGLGPALVEFASAQPCVIASVGGRAMFGARNTVPVVLLEPVEPLRALHLATLAWLEERGVEFRPDRHSGAAYRPHATVRGSRAVDPGARFELTELALIDRAPDEETTLRRVVAIAPLTP